MLKTLPNADLENSEFQTSMGSCETSLDKNNNNNKKYSKQESKQCLENTTTIS